MRILTLFVVLFLAGCSHTHVQGGWGGTGSSGGNASVGVSGSSVAWALIGIGLIAAEHGGSRAARERGLEDPGVPVLPLDGARRVNEQDCTQPIKDWSANLKCR